MSADPQRPRPKPAFHPRPKAAVHKTLRPAAPARASLARLMIRSAIILLCLTGFVYFANAVLVPVLNYEFSQQVEEW
jgi:hypothetical protein